MTKKFSKKKSCTALPSRLRDVKARPDESGSLPIRRARELENGRFRRGSERSKLRRNLCRRDRAQHNREWREGGRDLEGSQHKGVNVYRSLFNVVAAGHRAGVHCAQVVKFMPTVHGSVLVFDGRMMIPMNRALIACAAAAGDRSEERRVGKECR